MKKLILKLIMFLSPMWVRFFRYIAYSGQGTDICMQNGFLPMPIHFYSPVPDLVDMERRKVWDKKSELAGINFQPDQQIKLLGDLGATFGAECKWPPFSTGNPLDFYTENDSFSFGCAASLHSIIRKYKPKRIIEIGSGKSSLVISAALALNRADGVVTEYTIIDPYPSAVVSQGLPGVTRLVQDRVEAMDIDIFEELGNNDILFVDSGHTVRIGGDVNFLYLEVFPRLSRGVIIHIHDIGLPYEYNKVYFINPKFRVFWTEAYLLQAFLAFNEQFEIMLAMCYLMTEHKHEFDKAFPAYDPKLHKAISGSFWIRRKQ